MKNIISNWRSYAFLGGLTLCVCWLFAGRYGIFGAKVDWISQHSVFPEYFRQQFYETGKLFPEFAANLGGGQNIFNFSYYGLYSPIILLSYLFLFIPMTDYLMAASITGLLISVCLFYGWLGTKGFSREIRLWVSIIFLFAGPMVYQSCHQIMFINYMPFLCMALLGMDRHFERKKSGLYIVSVFLVITTSFYFSIGSMLVLVLYGASKCVNSKDSGFCLDRLPKDILSFLFPMFTAVLMSGLLLIPTAFAILEKRESTGATDMPALFIPHIPTESLMYNCYGIGLSSLILTVLIVGAISWARRERLLVYGCILIFSIPLFSWLLNGGLYARSKALIPFLPLLCYLIAVYLEKLKSREICFRFYAAAHIITIILLYCYQSFWEELSHNPLVWYLILADGILMFFCFLLFYKYDRISLIMFPAVLCLFIFDSIAGSYGELVEPSTYAEITDKKTQDLISQVLLKETNLCRMEQYATEGEKASDLNRIWDSRQWLTSVYSSAYHTDYQIFRETGFQIEQPFRNRLMQSASNNPLFQKLMGVKYMVKKADTFHHMENSGYMLYRTDGKLAIYKNPYAAPIAYATNRLISEKDYRILKFPYNQIALMRYAVVEKTADDEIQWGKEINSWAKPVNLMFPEINTKDGKILKTEEKTYHVCTKKKINAVGKVKGNRDTKQSILYLQFHIENKKPGQDLSIWVNGIRNRLSARGHIYYNKNTTFTYVTSMKDENRNVKLTFGEGDYEISDVQCFLGDKRILEEEIVPERKLYQSEFQADQNQTKGNIIQGKIQVAKAGRFITSIPYDSNFNAYVDGKKTAIEKVNTAFLGFAVEKGEHTIKIVYHAPGAKAGKAATCMGLLLFLFNLLGVFPRRRFPEK